MPPQAPADPGSFSFDLGTFDLGTFDLGAFDLGPLDFSGAKSPPPPPPPVVTAPVPAKPAETKPAESRPPQPKPVEAKPAATRPAETRPAEPAPAARAHQPFVLDAPLPRIAKPAQPTPAQPTPAQSTPAPAGPDPVAPVQGMPKRAEFKGADAGRSETRVAVSQPVIAKSGKPAESGTSAKSDTPAKSADPAKSAAAAPAAAPPAAPAPAAEPGLDVGQLDAELFAPEAEARPATARPRPVVHADAVGRLSREDALIHRVFAPLATHDGAFGLTDDAAALTVPAGHELVVTTDTLVAGVHFFADDPAEAIARKALRVNLSDLAAKAADPLGFVISTALPDSTTPEWLDGFARGLGGDAAAYGCPLFGGDTVRTPGPLTLTVTAFGTVPAGALVRRAGARPGDWVMVTGTIGDAALGLLLRRHLGSRGVSRLGARDKAHLAGRYLLPQPRTKLAAVLRQHVRAAMDVSDGLAGDLAKMCALSGVGARVETALLPLSGAASAAVSGDPKLLERVVTGGDDYELLMAVAPEELDRFMTAAAKVGVPVTAIGEITEEPGPPVFYGPQGLMTFKQMSFSHF